MLDIVKIVIRTLALTLLLVAMWIALSYIGYGALLALGYR